MEETILEVNNIHKKFKTYEAKSKGFLASLRRKYFWKFALNGVSFSVKKGEIVALLGKNGSGKSTLIKIILGIIYPDKGNVQLFNLDSWKYRQIISKDFGVVLGAHGQLYWNLPAIDTFKLMKSIYKINDRDFEERLKYFVKILHLQQVYKRQVRTMSLGEQMKCNFVASLLHIPKIVFLDEPTIGVDIISKLALKNLIREMQQKYKTTFILTTHIIEDIDIADRIIMMDRGKVIFNNKFEKLQYAFGNKRIIELYFKKPNAINYKNYGKVLKSDFNYIKLEVNAKTIKTNKFISILSDLNILDYKISEPGLNEIILKIYNKKNRK
ncbi:MAG: ATP-binding cassette domain-containing protein [Candidatus Marsarchaeota archaeon]|nr:ATP-binding cassette domain-containing protein [Candidatus Marsarchaeota archaeon]MCL5106443.1 ATP-binding cassette domain-containing protein [Candidatus Marsarchaeota archaeon]